jgi:phosphate acetyltransferase
VLTDIGLSDDDKQQVMNGEQLTFLIGADAAGIVLGARLPIILTSRADSLRARLASCAAAMLLAHAGRQGAVPGARGAA